MTGSKTRPDISVIIPTHDRLPVLQRVLDGLQQQDDDGFEVIVVDDASQDGTSEWLDRARDRYRFPLQVFEAKSRGAAAARNQGVHGARAGLILFLDADTIPSRSLVRRHVEMHRQARDPQLCLMGRIAMSDELKNRQQIRWNELDLHPPKRGLTEIDAPKYRTANSSLSRELFLQHQGFHPGLVASEDLEFALRLARAGVRFYYHDEICAVHHHPMNLAQYLDKGTTYGKAVAYWHRMNPDQHLDLAVRYGLYHPGLPTLDKLRYAVKIALVNRFSIPLVLVLAKAVRRRWLPLSERLYRAAFGFYLRREFHTSFHTAICVLGLY